MILINSKTADSIIKAYLLSKLTGDNIVSEGSDNLLFFNGNAVINAEEYCLDELAMQYQETFDKSTDWLFSYKGNELRNMISIALRHRADSKLGIMIKAVEDSFSKSIDYCLNGASANGKKLRSLCSDVNHEVWRMVGFIRFVPAGGRCLAARPLLFHDTAELILKELQNRYPNHKLVLVVEDHALCIQFGNISREDKAKYESLLEADNFDEVWESYYKSQYIEGRKNIGLAASKIPRKYWDWLHEGSILKSEE